MARDVARTLVEDFESATLSEKSTKPSWVHSNSQLWMCGASDDENEQKHKEPSVDEAYILEPFPNDQFIPDAWMDVLATVDVCVNETCPTVFCDDEGYDLVQFHMVSAVMGDCEEAACEHDPISEIEADLKAMNIREEISIHDNINIGNEGNESDSTLEDEGPSDQLFYDASDELEDYNEPDPMTIQLRDGKEIDIPNLLPNMQRRQRRTRQTRTKGQKQRREYLSKSHYLTRVGAKDCVKNKITGCDLAQEIKTRKCRNKTAKKQNET